MEIHKKVLRKTRDKARAIRHKVSSTLKRVHERHIKRLFRHKPKAIELAPHQSANNLILDEPEGAIASGIKITVKRNTSPFKSLISHHKRLTGISAIIIVVLIAFIGGMSTQSFIQKSNTSTVTLTPTEAAYEGVREVIWGRIERIVLPQITVTNTVTNERQTLVLLPRSIVLSKDSKATSSGTLHNGQRVLVYVTKLKDGTLNIDRIRALDI